MATLNLTATSDEQQIVLKHLIPMVSDVLAEKINNGVYIEKDGKRLLNKKDLSTFMTYAEEQAKNKIAEQDRKGKQVVGVNGDTIMSWAIHYFEEESIEGKLYNNDGTEYKPPKPITPVKKTTTTTPTVKVEPPKHKQQQASLWDMLKEQAEEEKPKVEIIPDDYKPTLDDVVNCNIDDDHDNDEDNEEEIAVEENPTIEEIADKLQQAVDEKNGVKREIEQPKNEMPIFYIQYMDMKASHKDEIVLTRLGDFYEAFDNDAAILADELDLTLTGRSVGTDARVPMVGFPYHAADRYINKIRNTHGIVIIESSGNVATLGKIIKTGGKTVDTSTGEIIGEGIEELSETEMREFDGDIQEPKADTETDDIDAICPPTTFDKETVIYLYDLLDGKLNIA